MKKPALIVALLAAGSIVAIAAYTKERAPGLRYPKTTVAEYVKPIQDRIAPEGCIQGARGLICGGA